MMREERAVICVCGKGLTLLIGGEAPTHVHKQDSGQIRPECFPVCYKSRVPAHRKGGTSGNRCQQSCWVYIYIHLGLDPI